MAHTVLFPPYLSFRPAIPQNLSDKADLFKLNASLIAPLELSEQARLLVILSSKKGDIYQTDHLTMLQKLRVGLLPYLGKTAGF